LVLTAVLTLVACETKPPSSVDTCPDDVPPVCPEPAPSYAADVAPLLGRLCGTCHTAGGVSANHPFDTYNQVQFQRLSIEGQLNNCLMPPADQKQPTSEERRTIFAWIVCGSMNN
jgi:uncharacterized membrane protein